jgi:hypothetical protein
MWQLYSNVRAETKRDHYINFSDINHTAAAVNKSRITDDANFTFNDYKESTFSDFCYSDNAELRKWREVYAPICHKIIRVDALNIP